MTPQASDLPNPKNEGFASGAEPLKPKVIGKKKGSNSKHEPILPPRKQIRKTQPRNPVARGGSQKRGRGRGGFLKSSHAPSTRKHNGNARRQKEGSEQTKDEEGIKSAATLPSSNQNTDQEAMKSKSKGKRKGSAATASLPRNAKSNKISKGKNSKVSAPKAKRSYNKKSKKLETKPDAECVNFDKNEP